MRPHGLLLVDGPSDAPLARHLESIARRLGRPVDMVVPDLSWLPDPPGREVSERLDAVLKRDPDFDFVVVHRDAERDRPEARRAEVAEGVEAVSPGLPRVPLVPIRMTEAWLLVDESAVRRMAGRPGSTRAWRRDAPS